MNGGAETLVMAREHTEPEHWARLRERLVRHLSARHDLDDPQVLAALGRVPRERFIPEPWREYAYADKALPIEHDQTISQPYIVALMSQCAGVGPGSRVLEVGTGCGYQTAVLADLGAEVFTIEIVEPLAHAAARLLEELGYHTVHTRVGDGHRGWPEAAPFDAIVVTAAPRAVPSTLVEQLALGGRLVLPVGDEDQDLLVLTRTAQGVRTEHVAAVRFVPMTGRAGASFVAEPGSDKLPAWR